MKNDILNLIKKRHSTRTPFDPTKLISSLDLDQILQAGSWSPTAHNMQNFEVVVVDKKQILEKIGKLTTHTSADFIRENFQQLSSTVEELNKKKTGILGIMFPPEWRTPGADFEKIARESTPTPLSNSMKNCPTLLIIIYDARKRAPASKGDVLGFISLGCVMENMWLMAESLGISFQILSVFAGNDVESELKKILAIPQYMKIAYAIRMGYSKDSPKNYVRIRRDLADFVHRNKF